MEYQAKAVKSASLRLSPAAGQLCRNETVNGVAGQVCVLRVVSGEVSRGGDIQFTVRDSGGETGRLFKVGDAWHALGETVAVAEFAKAKTIELFKPGHTKALVKLRRKTTLMLVFYSASRQQRGDEIQLSAMEQRAARAVMEPVLFAPLRVSINNDPNPLNHESAQAPGTKVMFDIPDTTLCSDCAFRFGGAKYASENWIPASAIEYCRIDDKTNALKSIDITKYYSGPASADYSKVLSESDQNMLNSMAKGKRQLVCKISSVMPPVVAVQPAAIKGLNLLQIWLHDVAKAPAVETGKTTLMIQTESNTLVSFPVKTGADITTYGRALRFPLVVAPDTISRMSLDQFRESDEYSKEITLHAEDGTLLQTLKLMGSFDMSNMPSGKLFRGYIQLQSYYKEQQKNTKLGFRVSYTQGGTTSYTKYVDSELRVAEGGELQSVSNPTAFKGADATFNLLSRDLKSDANILLLKAVMKTAAEANLDLSKTKVSFPGTGAPAVVVDLRGGAIKTVSLPANVGSTATVAVPTIFDGLDVPDITFELHALMDYAFDYAKIGTATLKSLEPLRVLDIKASDAEAGHELIFAANLARITVAMNESQVKFRLPVAGSAAVAGADFDPARVGVTYLDRAGQTV
ncbi:MAG: hypothetical protein ACRCU9_04195, partial [Iodobacter sp.]